MPADQPPFKVFRAFNQAALAPLARLKSRMSPRALEAFQGSGSPARIAAALAERRVVAVKEVIESFEFHYRTRRRLRAPAMADLCAGHGLTGLLFATEPGVKQLSLIDRRRPDSYEAVLDAVASVHPEVRDKVRYLEIPVEDAAAELPAGTHSLAVHACSLATDRCIDLAIELGGAIAAMPCCYQNTGRDGPIGIRSALGGQLATDIDRSYRLHAAGYRVDWAWVPPTLTPMNRILVAWRG